MIEPQPKGQDKSQDPYAELRALWSKDGHLEETVVSQIVYQAAKMRELYPGNHPLGATFAIDDAASGKNKPAKEILGKLTTLSAVLRNTKLQQDAFNAGWTYGSGIIKSLDTARTSKDVDEFRRVALTLCIPHKAGEKPITLAARIQAQASVK